MPETGKERRWTLVGIISNGEKAAVVHSGPGIPFGEKVAVASVSEHEAALAKMGRELEAEFRLRAYAEKEAEAEQEKVVDLEAELKGTEVEHRAALAKARKESDAEVERLRSHLREATDHAEKAERRFDSVTESYNAMKRARTEALHERDRALGRARKEGREEVREALMEQADEYRHEAKEARKRSEPEGGELLDAGRIGREDITAEDAYLEAAQLVRAEIEEGGRG